MEKRVELPKIRSKSSRRIWPKRKRAVGQSDNIHLPAAGSSSTTFEMLKEAGYWFFTSTKCETVECEPSSGAQHMDAPPPERHSWRSEEFVYDGKRSGAVRMTLTLVRSSASPRITGNCLSGNLRGSREPCWFLGTEFATSHPWAIHREVLEPTDATGTLFILFLLSLPSFSMLDRGEKQDTPIQQKHKRALLNLVGVASRNGGAFKRHFFLPELLRGEVSPSDFLQS